MSIGGGREDACRYEGAGKMPRLGGGRVEERGGPGRREVREPLHESIDETMKLLHSGGERDLGGQMVPGRS